MTKEEIKSLIAQYVSGQGNQVGLEKLDVILTALAESSGEGGGSKIIDLTPLGVWDDLEDETDITSYFDGVDFSDNGLASTYVKVTLAFGDQRQNATVLIPLSVFASMPASIGGEIVNVATYAGEFLGLKATIMVREQDGQVIAII